VRCGPSWLSQGGWAGTEDAQQHASAKPYAREESPHGPGTASAGPAHRNPETLKLKLKHSPKGKRTAAHEKWRFAAGVGSDVQLRPLKMKERRGVLCRTKDRLFIRDHTLPLSCNPRSKPPGGPHLAQPMKAIVRTRIVLTRRSSRARRNSRRRTASPAA